MVDTFDIIVIGSGPGGYVCAIRAAQLGLKTAIVEKDKHLGGTCLNVGCIPSKALLHSTEMYHFAQHGSAEHGIKVGSLEIDIAKLMEHKTGVVDQLRGGVQTLLEKRKVSIFNGFGKLAGDGKVTVLNGDDESETISAKHIVLATGSVPVELPFLKFDGETVVSSDDAIAFERVPENLVVVGGGAIGLELGSVWNRLGSKVTVLEFLPEIAATFDKDISKMVARIFKRQGMKIETETKVTGLAEKDGKTVVTAEKKGKEVEYPADKVLVAVGRRAFSHGVGLDVVGIELDDKGRIPTDGNYQTKVDGIYAIGDTTTGVMLAHKAEEEGVALAEQLAGQYGAVNYDVIPNVIYTEPEVASVGLGEDAAKERGVAVKVGKFPLAANGRAIATDGTEGVVKIIADAESDRLIGVQIIAKSASEMIASAVGHMEYGGSAEDLARTVHAHPTLSESMKEAALAVHGHAIHAL